MTVVVGLDISLTGTGVAVAHLTPGGPPDVRLAVVQSKPPKRAKGAPPASVPQRSARLRSVAGSIVNHCVAADLVVVEGPAYSRAESGVWDRAGLWWLVVARLTGAGLRVVEADPTAVKTYALGKGGGAGTDKDQVLAAVIRRYLPVVEVGNNNEADALVLAAMAARFCRLPIEPGGMIPAGHSKALDRIRWEV